MIDKLKIRILHLIHPQYIPALADSPSAHVLRRELDRATYDQHGNHENLTADQMRERTKAQRAKL